MLNGGDSMRKYDLKNRDLYLNKLKVFQEYVVVGNRVF